VKTYRIAEMDYDLKSSNDLRDKMIELRDAALKQGNMEWAVTLSHVIAFMMVAIDEMFNRMRPDNSVPRQLNAQVIVREIWPWLDDSEITAIASILMDAYNKR
jgi:hypothetical protein